MVPNSSYDSPVRARRTSSYAAPESGERPSVTIDHSIETLNRIRHTAASSDILTGLQEADHPLLFLHHLHEKCSHGDSDCNFEFVVGEGGHQFPVHREVVAASPPLRALVMGRMAEATTGKATVSDGCPGAFQLLIEYLYTGKVTLDLLAAIAVCGLAHHWDLQRLEADCLSSYWRLMTAEDACSALAHAEAVGDEYLHDVSMRYIHEHAAACLSSDSFSQLHEDMAYKLLSSDALAVSEVFVAIAASNWLNLHATPRDTNPTLWNRFKSVVRLPLVPVVDLVSTVRTLSLFSPDEMLDAIAIASCPQTPSKTAITAVRPRRGSPTQLKAVSFAVSKNAHPSDNDSDLTELGDANFFTGVCAGTVSDSPPRPLDPENKKPLLLNFGDQDDEWDTRSKPTAWVEANFAKATTVNAVIVAPLNGHGHWKNGHGAQLQHSKDGQKWVSVGTVDFKAKDEPQTITMSSPVTSKYWRLHHTSFIGISRWSFL